MHEKIPCSVLILTRNAGSTLERVLKNLAPFGEILVHDANSEDETVAIAQRYGARVLKQYDTEEKSVKVKNFTAIRLKQRADAKCDWVLYIDADEEMPPALVAEVGEILKHAHPKVIVKFPRLPVIDGRLRRHGIFFPEIVPRIHHRRGGCTLKEGKAVHEKYVYDSSFEEVITKHPLHVPLEPLEELWKKDDRYLYLEVERIRREGFPFGKYVRWFLLREPLMMLSMLFRILCNIPWYFREDRVPFAYEWRHVRYHWRLFRGITGAVFRGVQR